ncbi:MAG: class I SAM-dependent methyltransferase [Calditrichaeota bacterium]|nr:class I SAM-dependent methyltransferase [Calditrichota bacterium]MCB0266671.1 class I SAM-dependent methyltransferase [Calditrichota bacterium]MCB0285155.1 class I SAM-dependent methyltransferase [Calditrichota bacterium]MCB9067243.1 class I SAM-dependent methyltransferase [Calditrichia bacterium]
MALNSYFFRRNIERRVYQLIFGLLLINAHKKIQKTENSEVKYLDITLKKALNYSFSAEESYWVQKIELLRDSLNNNDQVVQIIDFGAGSDRVSEYNMTGNDVKVAERSISDISRLSNKQIFWTGLLFHLVRNLKPENCLELGSCVGISAAYIAAALELNEAGKLLTIEGAEPLATIASNNLQKLQLPKVKVVNESFQNGLNTILENCKQLDFVFLDGHHDGEATLKYFGQLYPLLSGNSVMVFDDIRWSKNMLDAWKNLVTDERIYLSLDLGMMGICIPQKP